MKIVFCGPQGSGKGTQAQRLGAFCNLPVFSPGHFFRQVIAAGHPLGKKIQADVEAGRLVSDDIVEEVIGKYLSSVETGFILDGFPRTLAQAKILDKVTGGIDHAVLVDVSDIEAVQRVSGRRVCSCGKKYHIKYFPPKVDRRCDDCGKELNQRPDDHPEAIRERLKIYHTLTEPIEEYYAKEGRLRRINGEQPPENVFNDLLSALDLRP